MNPAGRPVSNAPLPSNEVAVITPVILTLLEPLILTPAVNVAAVPVIILSVDATPVNPVPSPTKLVAVTTPVMLKPLASSVAAVPTCNPVAVIIPLDAPRVIALPTLTVSKNVDTPVTVAPPPTTFRPALAVTTPTESTLFTSS